LTLHYTSPVEPKQEHYAGIKCYLEYGTYNAHNYPAQASPSVMLAQVLESWKVYRVSTKKY